MIRCGEWWEGGDAEQQSSNLELDVCVFGGVYCRFVIFRGHTTPESPGAIWETPCRVSFSERESCFPLWKPDQGFASPAAFAANAWAHTWVWPTSETPWAWYTRKEGYGEPRPAEGTATPLCFPGLWWGDANNGPWSLVSALSPATASVHIS